MTEPRFFGSYEILREFAPATVGEVYLCRKRGGAARDEIPGVLKTFNPKLVEAQEDRDLLEEALHPNLIRYRQVGFDAEADRYFAVMDRLNVEPHSATLFKASRLELDSRLRRLLDVGKALAKLHTRETFHGAVWPHNVLVRQPERLYHMVLTDFGFWHRFDAEHYVNNERFFESWLFQAPEQILHAAPDLWGKPGRPPAPCPASDVYGWACLLLYSLNGGRDSFYRTTNKATGEEHLDEAVRGDLTALLKKKLDVQDRVTLVVNKKLQLDPARLTDFIFKCLSPDPRDRYDTMAEALEAFEATRD